MHAGIAGRTPHHVVVMPAGVIQSQLIGRERQRDRLVELMGGEEKLRRLEELGAVAQLRAQGFAQLGEKAMNPDAPRSAAAQRRHDKLVSYVEARQNFIKSAEVASKSSTVQSPPADHHESHAQQAHHRARSLDGEAAPPPSEPPDPPSMPPAPQSPPSPPPQFMMTEFDALAALYEATDGEHWSQNSNWLTPGSTPCGDVLTWHGIWCHREDADANLYDDILPAANYTANCSGSGSGSSSGGSSSADGSNSSAEGLNGSNGSNSSNGSAAGGDGGSDGLGGPPPCVLNMTEAEAAEAAARAEAATRSVAGRVSRLLVRANNLVGTLPTQLALLTALTDLSAYDNKLSGFLPSQLGDGGRLRLLQLTGALDPARSVG